MTSRTDKIAAYLSARVTQAAVERLRNTEQDEKFGIVSVVSVKVSPDLSYADVYVDSISSAKDLPKALAPVAGPLRSELSRKIGLHKAPIIRFRTKKEMENETSPEERVLTILDEISKSHAAS
jgi:ribosome-binding factor A